MPKIKKIKRSELGVKASDKNTPVIAIEYGHARIPRSNDKNAETYVLPSGTIVDLKAASKYVKKMHLFIEQQLQMTTTKKA